MDRHPQLGGGHEGGERVLEGGELGGGGELFDIIPKGGQGLVVSPYITSLAIKLHIFPEEVSLIADMPNRKICSTMIFAEV